MKDYTKFCEATFDVLGKDAFLNDGGETFIKGCVAAVPDSRQFAVGFARCVIIDHFNDLKIEVLRGEIDGIRNAALSSVATEIDDIEQEIVSLTEISTRSKPSKRGGGGKNPVFVTGKNLVSKRYNSLNKAYVTLSGNNDPKNGKNSKGAMKWLNDKGYSVVRG